MPFDKCPKCGYTEAVTNTPFAPGMYRFVNKATGQKAVIQRDNKSFVVKGAEGQPDISWVTESEYEASKIPAPAKSVTPTTPTAPPVA